MDELHPGLWLWTAEHPAWTPKDGGPDGWPQVVSCYAVALGESLVLIDPLDPPEGLAARATAVVVTCPAHSRDSARLGVPVHAPGDVLPDGIVAHPSPDPDDLVLWIPEHRALVFGDTLIDRGQGLEIPVDLGAAGALARRVGGGAAAAPRAARRARAADARAAGRPRRARARPRLR